ncbi:hypothetical protein PRNP1_014764 [Phytophthora ramorum]
MEGRCQRIRSRSELLETKVMFSDQFMRSMQWNYGPNGPMRVGERLKPIAIVLRPNESLNRYEDRFRSWLETKNVSLSMLSEDPEEERRYRQTFAYVRATSADKMHWGDAEEERSTSRPRSPSRSRSPQSRTRKQSADREINHGDDERQSKRPRIDYDNDRGGSLDREVHASQKMPLQRDISTTERVESVALQMKHLEEKLNHRVRELEHEVKRLSNRDRAENGANVYWSTSSSDVQEAQALENRVPPLHAPPSNAVSSVKSEPGQLHNADIRLIVTEVLKKAAKVTADPAEKRLVKDYTQLSNQVSHNELTLEDSLHYVKMNHAASDPEAAEHFKQIDELTVLINDERRRRDTVLAAVIAQEWRGRREELENLVGQVGLIDTPRVSHEQLTTIYSQLGRNCEKLIRLQSKLKTGLSAGRDNHVHELQDLSRELEAVLFERSALEDQRKFLCVELAHSNAAIYKMSMELIEEAHLWIP